jgi:archaellum biogenesis ATPase FlaH
MDDALWAAILADDPDRDPPTPPRDTTTPADATDDTRTSLDRFDHQVQTRLLALRSQHQARQLFNQEQTGDLPPLDIATVGDILQRDPPPEPRVEGLIPWDACTLVTAKAKVGKSTLLLSLAHSLITGAPALGRLKVRPIQADRTVVFLNAEMAPAQLTAWAHDRGVPPHRLVIAQMRGQASRLDDDHRMEDLARQLAAFNPETIIVDTFSALFQGDSQNDAQQVRQFLERLTRLKILSGALDLILTAHAGKDDAKGARGSTSLEDWPDSIIALRRPDDDSKTRFIKAWGRDIELEEDRLDWDPDTRTMTLTGDGNPAQTIRKHRVDTLTQTVAQIVLDEPGVNNLGVEHKLKTQGVKARHDDVRHALALAVDLKLIDRERGPHASWIHFPHAEPPDPLLDAVQHIYAPDDGQG